MHRKGFQGTGLTEVLAAAKAPKGSFYHYFPSKEAFGLAVLEHVETQLGAMAHGILDAPGLTASAKFMAVIARFRDLAAQSGYGLGCPVGKLAQEMSEVSEAFRAHLAGRPTPMTGLLRAVITEGQSTGEFDPGLDADEAARFLANAWQGALMRMKVTRDPQPLTVFERFARRLLTPPSAGPSE